MDEIDSKNGINSGNLAALIQESSLSWSDLTEVLEAFRSRAFEDGRDTERNWV